MRLLGLLVIAILAETLGGCGQKGPLVLPDAQHPHKRIGFPKLPTPSKAPPPSGPPAESPTSLPSTTPTQSDAPSTAPAEPTTPAPAEAAPTPQP